MFEENVNKDYTLNMAAENLNLASIYADKKRDIDALITIAGAWMQIGMVIDRTSGINSSPMGSNRAGFFPTEVGENYE